MARKLTLDDLKVQSFVTTLNAHQADQLVGGTQVQTNCDTSETQCYCTKTHVCGCTNVSNCCTTEGTQMGCETIYTDVCGCTDVCTQEFSQCNCTVPPESGC